MLPIGYVLIYCNSLRIVCICLYQTLPQPDLGGKLSSRLGYGSDLWRDNPYPNLIDPQQLCKKLGLLG